jgi:hypothetical protein
MSLLYSVLSQLLLNLVLYHVVFDCLSFLYIDIFKPVENTIFKIYLELLMTLSPI